jgi:hypothetical protein
VREVEVESWATFDDENGVRDFYEIEDWKQCELLIELIELRGTNDVRSKNFPRRRVRRPRRFGRTYAKLVGSSSAPFLSELMAGRPRQPTDS